MIFSLKAEATVIGRPVIAGTVIGATVIAA
jgi:hypothetical protein